MGLSSWTGNDLRFEKEFVEYRERSALLARNSILGVTQQARDERGDGLCHSGHRVNIGISTNRHVARFEIGAVRKLGLTARAA